MKRGSVQGFLISFIFLAIVFTLCLIFSEAEKKQSENNTEIDVKEEVEIQQPLDLKNFVIDEDGGFYVIEALLVPKEWKQ